MGVIPGVADFLCLWPGPGIGFIEMKTVDGKLSNPQKRFKWLCECFGIKWALARSVTEAHNIVKGWGLKCVHDLVREPDLRTFTQKHDQMNDALYGPRKYKNVDDIANRPAPSSDEPDYR